MEQDVLCRTRVRLDQSRGVDGGFFAVALVRRFVGHADHAREPTVDPGLPAKLREAGPERRPNDHSPKTMQLEQRKKRWSPSRRAWTSVYTLVESGCITQWPNQRSCIGPHVLDHQPKGDPMNQQFSRLPAVLAIGALALAGCAMLDGGTGAGPIARTQLQPTAGNTASGWVQFEQRGQKVLVTAEVRGLKPDAEHGFHVHEKPDCSAPDAMSAGGHFNPGGKPHAHHGKSDRHAGDMPNLRANAQGVASYRWESDLLTVTAGPNSVASRSVVVHRDPDDYSSQPAGNSGPRLACGVVALR